MAGARRCHLTRTLIADEPVAFVNRSTRNDVLIRTSDRDRLAQALQSSGISGRPDGDDGPAVQVSDPRQLRLVFTTQLPK